MVHGSGWFIDDIELPIAPKTDERSITRTFQRETLFNFFPELTKSTASAFDYTMTGYIYPDYKAFQLDQIAKSADTANVTLTIPEDQKAFEATKFAIKKLSIKRRGPLFTSYHYEIGGPEYIVKVYPFTLTLTELPDEGETQEEIDGFTDTDEDAVGTQQLNELIEQTGTDLELKDYGPVSLYKTINGDPII